MEDLKALYQQKVQDLENYFSQNNKVSKVLEFFSNYPKIIKVETSKMGNPLYIIIKLLEFEKSLPERITKQKDLQLIRDRVLLGMLFWGGVRESELIQTKKEDIDLINKTWNVKTIKQRKQVYRAIPLNHVPLKELKLWNSYFEYAGLKPNDLIFKMKRRNVIFLVDKYTGMTPHKFRHALGLFLYELTKDIRIVSQVLRHKNISNTFIYTRLSMDALREKLNEIYGYNEAENNGL